MLLCRLIATYTLLCKLPCPSWPAVPHPQVNICPPSESTKWMMTNDAFFSKNCRLPLLTGNNGCIVGSTGDLFRACPSGRDQRARLCDLTIGSGWHTHLACTVIPPAEGNAIGWQRGWERNLSSGPTQQTIKQLWMVFYINVSLCLLFPTVVKGKLLLPVFTSNGSSVTISTANILYSLLTD